jgi:hypothetical protein
VTKGSAGAVLVEHSVQRLASDVKVDLSSIMGTPYGWGANRVFIHVAPIGTVMSRMCTNATECVLLSVVYA